MGRPDASWGAIIRLGGTLERKATEVVLTSANAEHLRRRNGEDLVPLEDLIRQTPGAHPIRSVDELRCDAFETDEELDEFLAFVAESRHAELA